MSNDENTQQECERLRKELEEERARSARVEGFLTGLEVAATVLAAYEKPRRRKRPKKDWIEKTGDAIFGPIR